MKIEESCCSGCQERTLWFDLGTYWECAGCGKPTYKRTYQELQTAVEKLQEGWDRLTHHPNSVIQTDEDTAVVESLMTSLDTELRHLRCINGDLQDWEVEQHE